MSAANQAKIGKPPAVPPLKEAVPAPPPVPVAQAAVGWQPFETIPIDPDAKFFVRKGPKANAVLVRYRKTRAYSHKDMRFMPFLKLVEATTGVKLNFTPSEWSPATE